MVEQHGAHCPQHVSRMLLVSEGIYQDGMGMAFGTAICGTVYV